MTVLAPSWAMGAVGIDGTGDFHLAKGIHLRVFTAPEIGLPIRPFVVYRLSGEDAQRVIAQRTHTEITWLDSKGRVLTLPFAVTKDNPVTGTIARPPGVRAIAVAIAPGGKIKQPVTHAVRLPAAAATAQLTMSAFVDTPQGRRVIARRDAAPWAVAAPDIHGIVVTGEGTVQAAAWIGDDISLAGKLDPVMLLDLPVKGAARYLGLSDAAIRAEQRVRVGAPTRFGLHDDPSVSGPGAAAPASDDEEWKRVKALSKEILPLLKQVLDDTSQLPGDLTAPQVLSSGVKPGAFAQAQIRSLRAVLAATADPGMAKWLGYAAVDTDPAVLSSSLAVYLIRGFVAIDLDALDIVQRLSIFATGGALTADLPASGNVPFDVPHASKDGLQVFDYAVPVIVFPGAPTARPAAPGIGAPIPPSAMVGPHGTAPPSTSDGQGAWLADLIPPAAGREVVLPLSSLEAAPSLAAARLLGGAVTPLNDHHPETGRALALVPAMPDNAATTATGQLADRTVPPDAVHYKVAQADWFGRWSEFGERDVPAKARPLPPAPVFDLHYVVAAATPIDDAPRFGALHARIRVPRPEDLAPGSLLLESAEVSATIGGAPVTATAALGSPTQGLLDVVIPPPVGVIARAGHVDAVVTARWRDQANVLGQASDVITRRLVDPRPPAALVLDPTLRYSARPDAVGRSRIVLGWTAAAGVHYRVYTTDETRLRGALVEAAGGGDPIAVGLLTDLASAADAAARAQAYTAAGRAGLYTRGLFNNLTAEALAPASGPTRFSYDLSASLTVLAFFKIVAVSADNVESPFTDATLLPVGVPSGGPPPRPLLDFSEWTEAGAAVLHVTAVRGPQPATRWRLRRSFAESADPLRMPIVAEGAVEDAVIVSGGGDAALVFEIRDTGVDAIAGGALRPWTRTSWRVEVQAPSPPGSTLPGEWSPASGPAGSMRVPPPPVAPTDLAIESMDTTTGGVTLSWKHPETLQKGSLGGYRFDIYRRLPRQPEQRIASVLADDPSVVTGSGAARGFQFEDAPAPPAPTTPPDPPPPPPPLPPIDTTWRVVALDPLGRLSPPSGTVVRS